MTIITEAKIQAYQQLELLFESSNSFQEFADSIFILFNQNKQINYFKSLDELADYSVILWNHFYQRQINKFLKTKSSKK